ncbi:ABC transporter permease subunit [Fontivita pretiosa]|uniref:ABC transporter permease subunit n=1 Tax=Fontivita pretiosa TaxID=2989684 RepID=UPI003D1738B5
MPLHLARLAGLNPFGPIFDKELRITARRKRNHWLRVVYLGGLLLFLLMIYATTRSYGYYYGGSGGVAARVQAQNQLGKNFFATFSMFCVIAMGLIAPVLTSTAISAERLGKTLPVLLITPITSWQIISGKLFSRLLVALMLIGLSLPVLAVVRLLGGVETFQMFAVVCLCTAFAMSSAALGLFYSTLLNRAYAVILLSYGTMFVMYLAGPVIIGVFAAASRVRESTIFPILAASNPVANVAFLSMPDSPAVLSAGWIPGLIVQLSLTTLLVSGSAIVLRRYARRGGEHDRPAAQLPPIPAPLGAENPMQEVAPNETQQPDPAVQHSSSARAGEDHCVVGDNPVAWREFRRPLVVQRWAGLAVAIVLGLLLLSYCAFGALEVLDDHELQIGYACVFNALYWLLVAVLSATAIAQEKESDTWTLLLTTPLSSESIILGKVMGVARRMVWPTVLVAAHFAVFAMCRVISWTAFLHVMWVLVTFNTVWLASGVYLSLRMQKVTTAVIVNLMIPVVLFVAVPIALLVLGELIARDDDWAEAMTWYLPYMWMAQSVDRLEPRQFYNYDDRMWLPGWGYSVSVGDYTKMLLVTGAAHVLVAAVVLWLTVKRFNRLVGRAAQDPTAAPDFSEDSGSAVVHR